MTDHAIVPAVEEKRSAYDSLKPVYQRFVDGILSGERPSDVVRRLRPGLKHPHVSAWKWMGKPEVREALQERREMLLETVGITQQMIVRELANIAFGDPRELFHPDGRLKSIHELTPEQAAMIAGIEVELREDGVRIAKIKRWDKRQALRDLAELTMPGGRQGSGGTVFNVQINL